MDASVPLHQPGDMLFNAPMTREETWQTIPKRTRKKLKRRSGKPIDWIANLGPDGLPWAVTFGKRGLAAYRTNFDVFSFDFTPGSLNRVPVDGGYPSDTEPPEDSMPVDPPDLGINQEDYDILGNLPARAQRLLQLPFLDGQEVLSNCWLYKGTLERLDEFMFYLAGPREVTVATGTMAVTPGGTAHWSLTCYHATVTHTDAPPKRP
ncbi:hypothetical protein [Actinomadura madurae]|uniref:Uncharacterized protein n=1 Tax=Actinomadura madurae TaxID=1993 RepID=A0A1I4ZKF5_9ACTN|nr:hypothetical protein [Actinomadura madurae]SFN50724.1 hypothetical protein SAMN04489713_102238 [Actinomadura madurae]SPT49848.1 Uncharacterised protein [Actinomadura madurae]